MTALAYLHARPNDPRTTLARQRQVLEDAGYPIDAWHEDASDADVAATDRPALAALLAALQEGQTLVVADVMRLGRSATEVLAVVERLCDRGVHIVVHLMHGADLLSPAGQQFLSVLEAIAQTERYEERRARMQEVADGRASDDDDEDDDDEDDAGDDDPAPAGEADARAGDLDRPARSGDAVTQDLQAFGDALAQVLPALLFARDPDALVRWSRTRSWVDNALAGEDAPELAVIDLAVAYLRERAAECGPAGGP
jgi:hypothetical protein